MMQLLQLAEPVENSMKMYFDRRPELADKPQKRDINTLAKKNLNSNSVSLKKCVSKRGPPKTYSDYTKTTRKTPSDARQNVVKTIMFPTDSKENFVTDENKYLKKQKEEVKTLYENMIMKMEEDAKLRDEEIRLQTNNMNAKLQDLQRRKKNLEKLNNDIISGFMDLKYDSGINKKKLDDELELTKLQNEALNNSLKDVIRKNNVEREVGKKEYARKTRQLANALRNQVKNKEENANLVKEQYKQIQQIYSDKVNELQDKYLKILEKCNELRSRQGIQVEGYIMEMDRLRNELKKYEN
jgi:coiled-coil domain-containing protein 77